MLGLDIATDLLKGLQQGSQCSEVKLSKVLKKWMDLNGEVTPVTWETIIDVIKGPLIQNNDLAMEIKQSLKQESTRQQITTRE